MNSSNRLQSLQITICLGSILGIIFSHELWFPISRTFLRVPFLFEAPILVEQILTIILVISLIALIFSLRPKIFFLSAIASLILLIFFDQMRLQPWVYQYLLVLVVISLRSEDESNQTLGLVQILIAGLYFWGGVQKLNFTFSHETLPKLLEIFQNFLPANPPFVLIGLSIAIIEILIGIGLLFRKTRNIAVCLAIGTHTIILTLLIAKNYNSIVWIWNATLIIAVFITFGESKNSLKETLNSKFTFAKSIIFAAVLLPILSFAGWWDMYLSGALYSGNVEIGVVKLSEESIVNLSQSAQSVVFRTKTSNQPMLPLAEWAIAELNVPVYPQSRIFRQITQKICQSADKSDDLELIIKECPKILDGTFEIKRIRCAEVE